MAVCNSYAFTLQYLCFYLAITMLLQPNSIDIAKAFFRPLDFN